MNIKIFSPADRIPSDVILSNQTHGTNIVEIVTGEEDLSDCDGVWTRDPRFKLGIRTADCAPIAFWDGERFGIVHAGWRGLVGGICENMLEVFGVCVNVFVGPILPRFEIQRDFCYEAIERKFGGRYFYVGANNPLALRAFPLEKGGQASVETIMFDFEGALREVLPMAVFDGRSTFDIPELASWRRDRDGRRNVMVVEK